MKDEPVKNPLAVALVRAQAEMKNAAFNRINPHFKSKYADLAALREATLPALNANGLAITQLLRVHEGIGFCVHTQVIHESGLSLDAFFPIAQGTPQQMGSAITYGRRYSWASICGVASDDDDDANEAESLPIKSSGKSAHQGHKDGDYPKLEKELREQPTKEALRVWGLANRERISALPDSWQKHLRDEFERTMQGLEA